MEPERPIRVAIVGSGMAGLITAFLLNRDPHKRYIVKIFESGDSLSLDSASVSISNATQLPLDRIDVPMRAFAGGYYKNLKEMYDYLGVRYHAQPFIFSFTKAPSKVAGVGSESDSTYFVHASNFHQLPPHQPAGRTTIAFLADGVFVLACYIWFTLCCFYFPPKTTLAGGCETVYEYVKRIKLPSRFITYFLLPMMSSVATCSHEALLLSPARDLIEYKRRTSRMQHYVVFNGVRTVQDKLAKGIACEFSAVVSAVEPLSNGVKLRWKLIKGAKEGALSEAVFDRVILAVSPDVVGRIFDPLRCDMNRIPTTQVQSVVHSDQPIFTMTDAEKGHSKRKAQPIYLQTSTEGPHRTAAIHLQPSGVVVTTCPLSPIEPARIIQSSHFTRVLRTPESRQIVNTIFGATSNRPNNTNKKVESQWHNGDGNVWLVGGWCWDGMVLLEGCVTSAMRVADVFGVDIPWGSQSYDVHR